MLKSEVRLRDRLGFIPLLCILFLTGCGFGSVDKEDDSPVYKALLEHLGANNHVSPVLISAESLTSDDDRFQRSVSQDKEYEGAEHRPDGLLESLLQRNKKSINLPRLPEWTAGVRFIPTEKVREIFAPERRKSLEEAWRVFFQQYPGMQGLLSLSRPGFSNDRTAAIVYFEFECGPLCGQGNVAYLRKEGNQWKVESVITTWVS